MPKFKITFSDEATADQITAIRKALESKKAKNIEQEDGFFTAELNWGTKQKDLNNLMGFLNNSKGVNNAVDEVEHLEDSSSDSDCG